MWEERDEAIKQKYETLNNENIEKFSSDKDIRFGCKGKSKHWIGYKRHTSVDCQSGLTNRSSVSMANVADCDGFESVCPDSGGIYADKGYDCEKNAETASSRGAHLRAIKKNTRKDKNFDLDHYLSQIRCPYERVFSKLPHRTRFRGLTKNNFANLMEVIAFNIKRLKVIIFDEKWVSVG
ncbi:hypothetical protein FACS1894122_07770 [Alphaproteobacteria bacterium]|nr:hypothetical protein FACS1894122_07770 [Alphaproteobacteria bacterium]